MREIKFRAWDIKFTEMYPNIQNHINDKIFAFGHMIKNERFKIMQYTGLKDKNGKEIYEDSDIVKFKYVCDLENTIELIGIFNFNEESLRYEIEIFNNLYYTCLWYFSNGDIMYDFEIIGTKQENPELLEDKNV